MYGRHALKKSGMFLWGCFEAGRWESWLNYCGQMKGFGSSDWCRGVVIEGGGKDVVTQSFRWPVTGHRPI